MTMDASPDFLAAVATPGGAMAHPEVDLAPESSSAATQSPDFSALGWAARPGGDGAATGVGPRRPAIRGTIPGSERAAEEETVTELPFEVVPAANGPATPNAAEEKKGWWQRGKGKKPARARPRPLPKRRSSETGSRRRGAGQAGRIDVTLSVG